MFEKIMIIIITLLWIVMVINIVGYLLWSLATWAFYGVMHLLIFML